MAEKSNGYWKGFVVGLFLVPGVAMVVTLVGTIVVAIAGKRSIEE